MPKPKRHPGAETTEVTSILALDMAVARFRILGTTPIILNRLSEKAKRELLYPSRKKNHAERETTLKHNPLEEYRASPYVTRGHASPTRMIFPAGAFKKAIAQAAIDIPGAAKSQIGRLTSALGINIDLYGVPCLMMAVVRSSGMNRTPDIRTRACIEHWACELSVQYVSSLIRESDVVNLVNAAGIIVGVGDGRTEKGAMNFGSFKIVGSPADHKAWEQIVATGGREAQDAALAEPTFYDQDTEDMYAWWQQEFASRRSADRAPQVSPVVAAAAIANGKERSGRKPGRRPRASLSS